MANPDARTQAEKKRARRLGFILRTSCLLFLLVAGVSIWAVTARGQKDYSLIAANRNDPNHLIEFVFRWVPQDFDTDEIDEIVPHEWHLNMPFSFVHFIQGVNGDIGPNENSNYNYARRGISHLFDPIKGGYFAVVLYAVLDPNWTELKSSKNEYSRENIQLSLQNQSGYLFSKNKNYCIKQDEYSEFLTDNGMNTEKRTCITPKCEIYTNFKGWDVTIRAPRSIYLQSERICSVVNDFLNKRTIKIDNLYN